MSWRVNWYRANKNEPLIITNEIGEYGNEWNDVKINGDEIIKLLNIEPSEKIKNILIDLENNILNGGIENDEDIIKEYILKNWR